MPSIQLRRDSVQDDPSEIGDLSDYSRSIPDLAHPINDDDDESSQSRRRHTYPHIRLLKKEPKKSLDGRPLSCPSC
jgi:hypothetical protein